ncbi:RAB6A-GEF complex partner protein 2-like isoform X1 [Centruroides sculpturatus]|uniref:RAB6A-GEF complex partner protein 2-like isoform X1 n=2 Tax=Centruroides sculpturatus TaxID=218467 RepID=UPI000C6D5C70|nr:RAB6A-GEF complex partner protein 2-like isoform X1 [Centruroides sculpturatus]XP_023241133.1 RAB6A-GEF complex partner protein 2-like isoform X1 [Centruroides sculpturatus]
MIEVRARLARGAVFLSGETVECFITFGNPSPDPDTQSRSNSDIEENLAWASAQIHCQCSVDDTKVKFPISTSLSQEELATASKDTSFIPCRGENGHIVLSTKPKILFCDVRLAPGESKTYLYKETIPNEGPPSYRGQAVKYAYKITIGTQRVNAVIKLMKIPIRVLVLNNLSDFNFHMESDEMQVAPTNPFLQSQQKESSMEIALQVLEMITARRNPSFYNITNQNGKVVRFCILKSAYRLGEDIIGIFDFTKATVPCVQFSVMLQSEEILKEECCIKSKPSIMTVTYTKHHEFCLFLDHTQMILPIPLTITPAFSSEVVSLQWKLHFEFVTTTSQIPDVLPSSSPSESVMWQGPSSLDVQTMVWDLPVMVYPTHPVHIAQGLPIKCENSLIIT